MLTLSEWRSLSALSIAGRHATDESKVEKMRPSFICAALLLEMVASERVELSHPCEYRNLNPARLPIPPRGQCAYGA